ncbi:hypothetical protein [Streptomyces sp. NPDC092903]|uniref:hypothetical protein n=1 Tax=Streptomyces sp. NPDC092903 TaxID=3366017 RepID=UPI003830B4BC
MEQPTARHALFHGRYSYTRMPQPGPQNRQDQQEEQDQQNGQDQQDQQNYQNRPGAGTGSPDVGG